MDEGTLTLTRLFSNRSWKETMYKYLTKSNEKKVYEPKGYLRKCNTSTKLQILEKSLEIFIESFTRFDRELKFGLQ